MLITTHRTASTSTSYSFRTSSLISTTTPLELLLLSFAGCAYCIHPLTAMHASTTISTWASHFICWLYTNAIAHLICSSLVYLLPSHHSPPSSYIILILPSSLLTSNPHYPHFTYLVEASCSSMPQHTFIIYSSRDSPPLASFHCNGAPLTTSRNGIAMFVCMSLLTAAMRLNIIRSFTLHQTG